MLRLRQIALAGTDLAAAEGSLGSLLGAEVCFRDPGVGHFGLHNALFAVGDQFLEIVSPTQADTTAGRYINKRGGDTGYMVIFQTDDLASVRQRLDTHSVRTVFEANGDGVVGLHLHPKDTGGAIISIDRTDEPAAWPWAGVDWQTQPDSNFEAIAAVEIGVTDLVRVPATWAAILGRELNDLRIQVDDAEIRFTEADTRGEGVNRVDLVSRDRARVGQSVQLLNTSFCFV